MKKIVRNAYLFVLFFMFLRSLNAWFTWDMNNLVTIAFVFVTTFYIVFFRNELNLSANLLPILVFLVAIFGLGFAKDLSNALGLICNFFPILVFLTTPRAFKIYALNVITRWWLFILIPSLGLFLLSFFIDLPNLGQIENKTWEMYVYTNYVFFIKGQFYDIRFNSIFLEPGHLGMILAFFLYAFKFDLTKWQVWVMLIVEFFTLSLAGYVLVAIAYVFSLIAQRKSFLKFILYVSLFLGSVFAGARLYNNGDNLLNVLIVDRLQLDDEKGIVGNNRTSTAADDLFEEMVTSNKIWWGWPAGKYKDEDLGAGWQVFTIKFGLIPLILFAIFYFLLANKRPLDRRYNMLFLALLAIAFVQRAYPFWESWIIPFVCGMSFKFLREADLRLDNNRAKEQRSKLKRI